MKLAEFQSAFSAALWASEDAAPGPLASLRAQPAFAVYRNTVMKGCIDALEANFPSVARLVGSDWFRAAAALHVVNEAPSDGRLLRYGEGFAEFLDRFEPARELPYLADVARLDRCWTEAHIAADAPVVDGAWLAQLAPETLGQLRLVPHPAARWRWFADQPILSIWQRNRLPDVEATNADSAEITNVLGTPDPHPLVWQSEGVLITRPADAVIWCAVSAADCVFLNACARGEPLGHAAQMTLGRHPETDLGTLLAHLLRAGALSASSETGQNGRSSPDTD